MKLSLNGDEMRLDSPSKTREDSKTKLNVFWAHERILRSEYKASALFFCDGKVERAGELRPRCPLSS